MLPFPLSHPSETCFSKNTRVFSLPVLLTDATCSGLFGTGWTHPWYRCSKKAEVLPIENRTVNEPRFSPRSMKKDEISPVCAEHDNPDKQAVFQQKFRTGLSPQATTAGRQHRKETSNSAGLNYEQNPLSSDARNSLSIHKQHLSLGQPNYPDCSLINSTARVIRFPARHTTAHTHWCGGETTPRGTS